MEKLLPISISQLGQRFGLIGLVPGIMLTLLVLMEAWSGLPGQDPNFGRAIDTVRSLSGGTAILLVLLVLVGALIAQPLQLVLVQALEGYWPRSVPFTWLANLGTRRQRHLYEQLDALTTMEVYEPNAVRTAPKWPSWRVRPSSAGARSEAEQDAATWALNQRFPDPDSDSLLPTSLGNALRAAEARPRERYGLDAVLVWPRLYPLLPERQSGIVDDLRNQLDVEVRFTAVFTLAAIISAYMVVGHGWWQLLVPGLLSLAWLSYKGAVQAAISYGYAIDASFDLYRFDLLKALHLPLPADPAAEKAGNGELSQFIGEPNYPWGVTYLHPSPEQSSDGGTTPPRSVPISAETPSKAERPESDAESSSASASTAITAQESRGEPISGSDIDTACQDGLPLPQESGGVPDSDDKSASADTDQLTSEITGQDRTG